MLCKEGTKITSSSTSIGRSDLRNLLLSYRTRSTTGRPGPLLLDGRAVARARLLQRQLLLCRRLLLTGVLGHTSQPVDEDGHADVEHDVHLEETEVSPAVMVVGAEALEEGVGLLHGAELAVS